MHARGADLARGRLKLICHTMIICRFVGATSQPARQTDRQRAESRELKWRTRHGNGKHANGAALAGTAVAELAPNVNLDDFDKPLSRLFNSAPLLASSLLFSREPAAAVVQLALLSFSRVCV